MITLEQALQVNAWLPEVRSAQWSDREWLHVETIKALADEVLRMRDEIRHERADSVLTGHSRDEAQAEVSRLHEVVKGAHLLHNDLRATLRIVEAMIAGRESDLAVELRNAIAGRRPGGNSVG